MSDQTTLWAAEEAFWILSAAEAARRMDDSAIMVFGPTGILQGQQILRMIEQAPRWDRVEMTDRHSSQLDDITVLAYRARANRQGQQYQALCSSSWVRRGNEYLLLCHQQTPV